MVQVEASIGFIDVTGYGRWGLAWLESLLRAAHWSFSASPSRFVDDREPEPALAGQH